MAEVYNYSHQNALYKGSVQGHDYSLVETRPTTYTYAVEGNKLYITNGAIGTIQSGYISIDGLGYRHKKIK